MTLDEIYIDININEKVHYINVIYAIDWLYLLGAVKIEKDGCLCLQKG